MYLREVVAMTIVSVDRTKWLKLCSRIEVSHKADSSVHLTENSRMTDTTAGTTSADIRQEPDTALTALRIAVFLVGVIGLLDNGTALFTIRRVPAVKKRLGNIYLVHQCIVDLLCSLFLMINYLVFLLAPDAKGYWKLVLCKIAGSESFFWAIFSVSTFNLILLNVDRYVCIVFPTRRKFLSTQRVKWCCIAISWMVAIGIVFTVQVISTDIFDGVCFQNGSWPSVEIWKLWGIVYFVSSSIVPLAIFGVCYAHIFWVVQKSRIAVESGSTLDGQEGEGGVQSAVSTNRNLSKEEKEVLKMLVFVCLAFGICVTPCNVYYLLANLGYELDFSSGVYYFLLLLLMANCCTNPFVYLAKVKEFRVAIRNMARCVS